MIAQLNQLSIGYSTRKEKQVVAEGLTASLKRGQMTCLLGANGTGKSTLMRTMCGFLKPLAGSMIIDGNDVMTTDEKAMARLISVVLTDRVDVPNATVEEIVGLGRSPYTGFLGRMNNDDYQTVNHSLEQCHISHKRHALLSELSDGEKQKVFIAKALAQDTPLIVLDEPTAFLDLPSRVEVMQLLRELCRTQQKCILMSTHDLDLALQMADRLWIMQSGIPLITGSPEDLLLSNAFQPIFNNRGIEFDNRSGLFQIKHHHLFDIEAKGHGFEFVLLRRALARKGIRLLGNQQPEGIYICIKNDSPKPYSLWIDNEEVTHSSSCEAFISQSLEIIYQWKKIPSTIEQ
jgi:iron complex transport system ATP-binding protein